jgi:hypothetical protein
VAEPFHFKKNLSPTVADEPSRKNSLMSTPKDQKNKRYTTVLNKEATAF